jgi:hypothetical protein
MDFTLPQVLSDLCMLICRQHAAKTEDHILEDRQSCLETLLQDVASADEAYRERRADRIRQWQIDLVHVKKHRESIKTLLTPERELPADKL